MMTTCFGSTNVVSDYHLMLVSQALNEAIKQVNTGEPYHDMFTSEFEFSEFMTKIRKDLVVMHGEMILLISYSSLNFAGKKKGLPICPVLQFKLIKHRNMIVDDETPRVSSARPYKDIEEI